MNKTNLQPAARPAGRNISSPTLRSRFSLRLAVVLSLMMVGVLNVRGQSQYVFMRNSNSTTYYYASGATWSNASSFSPSYIWTIDNSVPKNNNRYLVISRSGGIGNRTFTPSLSTNTSTNYTFVLSDGNAIYHNYTLGARYLTHSFGNLSNNPTSGDRVIAYQVTTTAHSFADNTTKPTISISGFSGNKIQFTRTNLTGTYTRAYTTYSFNSTTHNWYDDKDNGSSTPTVNVNTLSPNYTWSIQTGGSYASINSTTGELTITGNPSGNIVVRLTVSNISPLSDKTVDFTLTRASIAQNEASTTTLTDPSITPVSAGLEYNQSQQFSVSTVTATTNTTTIPAHITLTGGSNTYYYYNGTLYTSTDGFKSETTTHPDVTYSWTLTGHDGKLTPTSGSGSSITVKHSTQATTDTNATLTVTASASGESKTATASVKAYSAIAAPTITQSGSTISLATTSSDATIYYTTDGSTPTANSNRYSAPFNLTTSPTTIKAIAIRNTTNATSGVATKECSLKLPKPVISISSTGLATIQPGEGSPSGLVIHYTTNNSQPTSSSATYSAPVQLSALQTIMAIAVLEGYENSDVASGDFVTQGVSDGKVILDDREDHTWTYYSGIDTSVDGGNYNTNYLGKMYSPNPRNVKITYRGKNNVSNSSTVVKVSRTENDSVFVYYKTLEQGNTNGEYPYQVISNPFSVRPSTGTGNSKKYYGFAGWKIVSGGEYIKNHSNNDVLSLDEQIVFNNLPYPSVNCTSAEIVFETTWTQATVVNGSSISLSNLSSSGTYETNFYVLTGAYTTAWTGNKNVTVTSVYPDGSSDVRADDVYTNLNVTVNSGYTVKYEYIYINNNNTTCSMGSGSKTLYIGRGVSNTSENGVVCNLIQGYNDAINNGGLTYTLKIESGVYNYLSFIKGYDGSQTNDRVSGTVSVKGILGCDYDRAKNDNNKLKIKNQIMMGYANDGRVLLRNASAGDKVLDVTLKSGNLQSSLTSAGTADASQSFYIGIAGEYSAGYRVFTMEGGEMWSLAAGLCNNTATTNSIRFRIKDGLIKGSIYGSAANANSYGYKQMIITGGTIRGWIAGGGNGTSANGGTTTGSSYIYVGGNARVDSNGSDTKINSSLGGQVFGSGSGVENTTTWGEMLYGSNVVIADNAYIERNVFGGGNFGWTDEYANIYLTGQNMSVGNVYGGANQNKGDNVIIYMTGGTVREGLYGGSNTTGTINYNVEMHINGGQVGSSSRNANIHGGGYGQSTIVTRNVDITLGSSGQTKPGVTVYGDVYGGSALGSVNGTSTTTTYHTNVTLNAGTINGSLYGGALGSNSIEANVYGPVTVTVNGGSVKKTDANGANGSGAVYGCNNINGAPQRAVSVIINGTDPAPSTDEYALFAVYGGGNKANYTYGTPTVTVNNCDNSIEYVYGGGNAAHITNGNTDVKIYGGNKIGNVFGGGNGTVTAANVSGNTNVNIYGGTIGRVFGGSNSAGSIGGTLNVNIEKSSTCAIKVGSVYSGGNKANSNLGSITVGCMADGDMIDSLFCGANQANVTGNVNFTMTGGRIGNLFGGNNQSGNVSGSIAVTVNWTTGQNACPNNYLGNVFGGGNLAQYSSPNDDEGNPTYPHVNILNGTVSGNVYGGGKGLASDHTKGQVTGNPVVTIGDNVDVHQVTISGSVFGGGDAGNVVGTPVVNVAEKCNTVITTAVYGGGNAADVTGTNVTIYGGTIGDVFGGGNGAVAAANVTGATSLTIHGGTITRVFAGGNTAGTIGTNSGVTIDHSSSCDQSIAEVYGGGNLAAGNAGTVTIQCSAENIGDVYGGANQADISNDITLNITGGQINNVFGGNNTSGSISGGITVNINKDASCNTFSVNNVYGGGNLAQYTIPNNKALAVNILNGTVSQNVYGGGKGLASDHSKGQVTGNPVVTIGDANNLNDDNVQAVVSGDVYGGGDAGNVVGTPQVNVINKCNTSIANVYGGGNAADVSGTDVNIDGGNITGMVFGGGHGNKNATPNPVAANVGGNVNVDITGGTINKVFGGSNSMGNITGTVSVNIEKDASSCQMHITEVYGGGNEAAGNAGTLTIGCTGDYETNREGIADVYGGANAANIGNNISLTIRGGHIDRVFGGNNTSGSISGTISVEVNWDNTLTCSKYLGNVFGGGNLAAYTGSPTVTLTNGTVSHSVFGGGNEAGVGGSTVNINGGQVIDGVYGGCNTSGNVSGNIIVNINGGTLGVSGTPLTSGIFGGGFGSATTTGGNVTVNVGDASATSAAATLTIWGDIYGGSALGTVNDAVADQTTVNINNGTIHGNIYGGGLGAATLNDKGYIASITTEAIVNGTVHVNIGTEQQNSNFVTVDGQVFGCNNLAGTPKGNVYVDVYHTAHTAANTYPATEPAKATDVTELAPTAFAIAAVYGGGNLADYTTTTENAATHVHIHNCDNTIEYVYGGGNAASSPATDVIIDGGRFNYIFGGGNGKGDGNPGADIEGDAAATLNGGIIYRAFGGSNTKGNIGGTSTVDLPQTTTCTRLVKELFGGGNEAPGGSVDMVIPCGTTGTGIIYAGANNADMGTEAAFNAGNPVTIKLTVEGGDFTQVFGGNNQGGTIWGNVELYIKGGTIGQAFGGNNLGGNIKGSIKVFVIEDETSCPLVLTDVYGGGYNAAYTPADPTISSPQVYIFHKKAGTAITGNVFGGGLGATAIVTANPKVIIGDYNANHSVTINGDVYGGGDAGNVVGTPSVIVVNKCNTSIANVYGGGNAANVNGTIVKIEGGTITNDVFGGGHGDKASLNQGEDTSHSNKTANVNGNTSVTITGGTINRVFAGSNINGTITGTNNELIINKSDTAKCDLKIAEVYGGGNQAAGNATTITIGKTGTWTTDDNDDDDNNNFHNKHNTTDNRIGYELEGIGTVYGGANAADIGTSQSNSNIKLSINNGIVNNVFGGNNSSGVIYGTITVNINRTSNVNNQWYVGNVYGGGNLAAYSHSGTDYPAVNIQNGTVSGSVFGGGFGTTAVVTANPHVTVSGGTITGDVFGGGEEAGVTGNPTVLMTGGQVTNVYGGGKQANVTGDNTVRIEGGTVTTDVYGGGMQGDVSGNVTVNISSDTYSGTENVVTIGGDVYGGGALANTNTANRSLNAQNEEVIDLSNTSKKTIVNLYPGATIGHDVYGGGRGQKADNATQTNAVEAVVYGNVTVYQMGAILTAAYSDEGLATGGRIFGGNNINGSPKGHVKVHVSKTTGTTGQQRSSNEARASATATHTYELAAVYGGGNQAEYNPYSSTDFAEVEIDGCNDVSIHSVYGGGNAASTPATLVTIDGAYEIEYVFGGGNGAGRNNPGANVGYHDYGDDHAGISQEDVNYRLNSDYKYGTGVAKTNIYGGRIHNIYGGSNTRGNVRETAVAMLDEVNDCPLVVDGIYGGGREAYMEGGTSIELGCITGLDEIYGGSEKADVGSSVALTITSGHFGRVFGGNNKSGKIFGSITVNIEQTGCVPITIDELYLGGNNAPYSVYGYEDSYTEHNVGTEQASETVKHYNLKKSGENPYPDPVLNIRSFKSIGTVYGGGKGVYATMVGDPTVDINVTHGWVNGEYVGTVAELNQYKGAPAQLAEDGVIGTVFGGGNAAEVIGSPQVKIGDRMGSTVELSSMSLLYESIDDEPYIEHGDIRITKDGTTGVTYTNKTDGTKTLTEAISQTVYGATITGNVYGGGNAADVTGNTEIQIGPTQTSGGGQPSPAPQRTEQPAAQTDQPAAPAQTQPASQTQNAATEAPQGRAVTPTRQ